MKTVVRSILAIAASFLFFWALAGSARADWTPPETYQPKTRAEYEAEGYEIRQASGYEYVVLYQTTATGRRPAGRITFYPDGSFRSINYKYLDDPDETSYDCYYDPADYSLLRYDTLRYTASGATLRKKFTGYRLDEETVTDYPGGSYTCWYHKPSDPRQYFIMTETTERTITEQEFEDKLNSVNILVPCVTAQDMAVSLADYRAQAQTDSRITITAEGDVTTVKISDYSRDQSAWHIIYRSGTLDSIEWTRETLSRVLTICYDISTYAISAEKIAYFYRKDVTYRHFVMTDGGFDMYDKFLYRIPGVEDGYYQIRQSEFEAVFSGGQPDPAVPGFDPPESFRPESLAYYRQQAASNFCIEITEVSDGSTLVTVDYRNGYRDEIRYDPAGSFIRILTAYYKDIFSATDYQAWTASYDIRTFVIKQTTYTCVLPNGGRYTRTGDVSGTLLSETIIFSEEYGHTLIYGHSADTAGDTYTRRIMPGNKEYSCTREEFEAVLNGGEPDWDAPAPANIIRLPESLTAIEANAFAGAGKVEAVLIPQSVTSIDPSAFTSKPVIYGKPGTYAETFANANGLTFIGTD